MYDTTCLNLDFWVKIVWGLGWIQFVQFARYCVLEYDKLIVDHKVYVWNEVRMMMMMIMTMMMMMTMPARWRVAWWR